MLPINPHRRVQPRLPQDEYSVGWICALPVELAAAETMLDEEHVNTDEGDGILRDTNLYSLGRMGGHNVVIACLPAGQMGTTSAAVVAMQMKSTFTSIRFGLMVGIGGGVPGNKADIRLGDVVIGQPNMQHGGVVQYDFGKSTPSGFQRTGFLNTPPHVLLNAVSRLQANYIRRKSNLKNHLSSFDALQEFSRNSAEPDVLFKSTYQHIGGDTCTFCDRDQQIKRDPCRSQDVVVHYGTIASGNRVIRDGITRDKVSSELDGVLCFEMEAAGLMNSFPCLVVRGICDYADSHKNKRWQAYAAATAAACAKEVLSVIPAPEVAKTRTATDTINHEILRRVIDYADLDDFLSVLSPTEQDTYIFSTPSLESQPEFSWVFRNIDYQQWNNFKSLSPILWLSAPPECKIHQVSSHKVHEGMDAAQRSEHYPLFFFCSAAFRRESIITVFIHTVLSQIIRFSPMNKKLSIGKIFFSRLLDSIFAKKASARKDLHDLKGSESQSTILRKIVDSAANEPWEALQAVLADGRIHDLSITVDGLGQDNNDNNKFCRELLSFVEKIQRTSNAKILFTSQPCINLSRVFDGLPCIEYDKERKECLSTLRFENTRFNKISMEHEGSCEWLWMHPQYKEWSKSDSSRILLIQGKPGSGKSTLTKYFSENAQAQQSDISSAIVAKFFYSYREGELQKSHHSMLRLILYDILRQYESFFYHRFQTEFRAQSQFGTDWSYTSLKKVLKSLQDYSMAKQFYLIIDAVDESETDDRREILKLLFEICSETKFSVVKIFMASRPEGLLESRRNQFGNFIRLQDETKHAIANFARSFLDGLNLTHVFAQAIGYMVDNAQGVFLWVKLIGEKLLAYYEKGYSEEEILDYLQRLPTDVKDLYEQMFKNMDKEEFSCYGVRMFQFVLFGKRPLTVDELLHALATPNNVDMRMTLDGFHKRISGERRIIYCGGNFLDINSYQGVSTIQVMHQTVREFFLDSNGTVAKFGFQMVRAYADVHIFKTCVWYLMLFSANTNLAVTVLDTKAWTLENFEYYAQYLNHWPLASYALFHLKDHLDGYRGDESIEVILSQFINQMVHAPAVYLLESWIRSHLKIKLLSSEQWGVARSFKDKVLHAAARNGFLTATEVVLVADVDVNTKDPEGRTALSWAAANGHGSVVRLLLENPDINADSNDQLNRTPLSWAAWSGQEAAARLLLDHPNVSANSKDKYDQTPLSWAAWNGHEEVVRLLVNHPAVAPFLRDKYGQTPLAWAAWQGQEAVVRLLADHPGMDPDSKDKYNQTPLAWAAWSGNEAVVRFLAERPDVNADSKDADGRTPLFWAASNGHEGVVRLLADLPNVTKNQSIYRNQTALLTAAQRGQDVVMWRLLQNRDCTIEAKDEYGRTALHLAAIYGHREVVRRLLNEGAAVDARDNDGGTALHWAARNVGDAVVRLLLKKGAAIEAKDNYGKTALHWATQNGRLAIVDLLLYNGAIDV